MTPILAAWLLMSLAGLVYTLLNLRAAWRDREAQRETKHNGVLQVVTTSNLRREWVRLGFWGLAILVGVAAWLGFSGDWVGWALIVIMGLQAYNSWADRRERVAVGKLEG